MEELMLRDRTDTARRLGAADIADLEDIVAEVFASLAGEDAIGDDKPIAPRQAIEKRANPQRRTSAVPERRQPTEVAEDGMVPASSPAEVGDEHAFADRPDPPADPELPMGELYSRGGGEALAIAAEDADFVRQAAAWLATRPNAEQLLDRVWLAVIECRSGPQHFGEGDPDTSRSSPEGEKGG
jgi:hypothetical protein